MPGAASPQNVLAAAEPMLVAVVGLLVLVVVGLIAMAIIVRRRSRIAVPPSETRAPAPPPPAVPPPKPRPRPPIAHAATSGGLAVATATSSSTMVCPTCRTEFLGMTYCTRDARRLVPPEEMLAGPLRGNGLAASLAAIAPGKSAGVICMACRRAYEPGLRSCPHDGNELVPVSVYNAMRARRGTTEPTGVIARVCPICGARYDLNARFCGHDAGQLVVIN